MILFCSKKTSYITDGDYMVKALLTHGNFFMIALNNIYVFSFKILVISKYIFTKLSILVAVCYGYANETEQSP